VLALLGSFLFSHTLFYNYAWFILISFFIVINIRPKILQIPFMKFFTFHKKLPIKNPTVLGAPFRKMFPINKNILAWYAFKQTAFNIAAENEIDV
jgi:hypothetical protein